MKLKYVSTHISILYVSIYSHKDQNHGLWSGIVLKLGAEALVTSLSMGTVRGGWDYS